MTAPDDVHHLLTGAGQVLDDLRHQEKDLEERLAAVRERLSAGQAVLAAVERWRSLSAGPVAEEPAGDGPGVDAGRTRPAMTERIALLPAQDPARTWSPEQVVRDGGGLRGAARPARRSTDPATAGIDRGRLRRRRAHPDRQAGQPAPAGPHA